VNHFTLDFELFTINDNIAIRNMATDRLGFGVADGINSLEKIISEKRKTGCVD